MHGDRSSAAEEFGCERELEYIATMLEEGSGADLQAQDDGAAGMEGLVDFIETPPRLDRARIGFVAPATPANASGPQVVLD